MKPKEIEMDKCIHCGKDPVKPDQTLAQYMIGMQRKADCGFLVSSFYVFTDERGDIRQVEMFENPLHFGGTMVFPE